MQTKIDVLFYLGLAGSMLSIIGLILVGLFSFILSAPTYRRNLIIGLSLTGAISLIVLVVSLLNFEKVYKAKGIVHNPKPDTMRPTDKKSYQRCKAAKIHIVRVDSVGEAAGVPVDDLIIMVHRGRDRLCHGDTVRFIIKDGKIHDADDRERKFKYAKFLLKVSR